MELRDKERGANVRRNLRRWWKQLLLLMAGWLMLAIAVSIGAITYARAHHFSQARIQMLAETCGAILVGVLILVVLVVLVMADRNKSP